MPNCAFVTFGCKINQYDTQAIREEILDLGYVEKQDAVEVDLVVVNSCTVTERAGEKVEERVRTLIRRNPAASIIVTGCISEDDRQRLELIPEVDHLIGNEEKHRVAEILQGAEMPGGPPRRKSRDIFNLQISGFEGRTRAFLKIQDGCDSFCSYCIIPHMRGSSRSRQQSSIIEEAERLACAGFSEVVLTGIHLRQWGLDLGIRDGLGSLLSHLLAVEGVERIRLSSIGEGAFTDRFLGAFEADPRLCRFFHVPLQSGSDRILQRMRRDYSVKEFMEAMKRIGERLPRAGLATDVIVGFPGETEEDFQRTLDVIEEVGFSQVHLFPYSPRPRTSAARLDLHVDGAVRQQRMQRARALGREVQARQLQQRIGDRVQVLVEKDAASTGSTLEGLSREGFRVAIEGEGVATASRGVEIDALVNGRSGRSLLATMVPSPKTLERESIG